MRLIRTALLALLLFAVDAHAGRLSGRISRGPVNPEACDTLGVLDTAPHTVHARIMQGATRVWEDSIPATPPVTWELYYPTLNPGTYQVSSWTTKATNDMVGCPEVITHVVEARYKIIFGWTTVGAVYDNQSGKVIGAAEMLRKLNECEATK